MKQKIAIQEVNIPRSNNTKDQVKWICDSLDLINGRDTDKISFKIMYKLLNLFSKENLVSTNEISKLLNIKSCKTNHHIRRLMESRIVFREKRKIALRGGSLSAAIEGIKRDSDAMFIRLLEISKKIDKVFEL